MDIQMPEMDGLAATKELRANGFNSIPIIAMTANAMKGDREICLGAGMNDYITKPVKREIIFEIIEKWLHRELGR
jgi:CheY-like chemotaxis protein